MGPWGQMLDKCSFCSDPQINHPARPQFLSGWDKNHRATKASEIPCAIEGFPARIFMKARFLSGTSRKQICFLGAK